MKIKTTFEKFNLLNNFYNKLDNLVYVAESDEYYVQMQSVFGINIPKSTILFDRAHNIEACKLRFAKFVENSIYEDASYLVENLLHSYLSVLEISEGNVRDKILNREYIIENLRDDLIKGERLIGRIVEIDSKYFLLGDSYPCGFVHSEMLLAELEKNSENSFNNMSISYLKEFSADILMFFIITALQNQSAIFYDEQLGDGEISIFMFNQSELTQFISIYPYGSDDFYDTIDSISVFYKNVLLPINQNYSAVKRIDFYNEVLYLCKSGSFKSQTDFIFFVHNMMDIYKNFSIYNSDYKVGYEIFKEIKKDIFKFITNLKTSLFGLYYDETYLELPFEDFFVAEDIEIIASIIDTENISLNSDGLPTQKALLNIADALDVKPTKEVKQLNSSHFPYIDFLFRFMTKKNLLETFDVVGTSKKYLEFKDLEFEEIMSIVYTAFFNEEFISAIYPPKKSAEFLNIFHNLFDELKNSPIVINEFDKVKIHYINFLYRLGLIQYNKTDSIVTLSAIGHILLDSHLKDNIIPFKG